VAARTEGGSSRHCIPGMSLVRAWYAGGARPGEEAARGGSARRQREEAGHWKVYASSQMHALLQPTSLPELEDAERRGEERQCPPEEGPRRRALGGGPWP